MPRIVLTGGGTAGHVMPHLAMLPLYRKEGWDVRYIGSSGIEKSLVEEAGIEFHTIKTGKLRRYFDWQNFLDVFRLVAGVTQCVYLLAKIRPQVVFSKGGFVSVPVAAAAWLLRIPVASHESDLTPGLANRLIEPFCSALFYAFPETAKYLRTRERILAGIPVRESLFQGSREEGLRMCGFPENSSKKTLLVMGGSLGAERINLALQELLPELVERFQVIHLTGKGKQLAFQNPSYKAFEYVSGGIQNLFACADLIISRAGANSLFEFKALCKPMLLIPLEIGSRGDQVHNAKSFENSGWALVLGERDLNAATLRSGIDDLERSAEKLRGELQKQSREDMLGLSILNKLGALSKHK